MIGDHIGQKVAGNGIPIMALGMSLVAGEERRGEGASFRAFDPASGRSIGPAFYSASDLDVSDAVSSAARVFSEAPMSARLTVPLLRLVAQLLEDSSEVVIATCVAETGLSVSRLRGELGRTSSQLRFLAEVAERGERLDATIDRGVFDGSTPELRKVRLPIGPVAVFGASNFPLAFSVLGGDTASALAAGCPVVVKAHQAHPATSELCGRIMASAISQCGLDGGWFSLLQGNGSSVGARLVQEPDISAVAFTGSLRGGRSLFDLAARRPNPVPVFAEMGSMNPVFVTRAAIQKRRTQIALELVGSIGGSAGQLCTKPGLIFVPDGPECDAFARDLSDAFEARAAEYSLTSPIREMLATQFKLTSSIGGVEILSQQSSGPDDPGLVIPGRLFRTNLAVFKEQPGLQIEHFGASAILVACPESELASVPRLLEGSLTGTIYLEPDDEGSVTEIVTGLARRIGRLVVNGVPTGVRVARGMHHGGPYPATTSARDTSVGSASLDRFLRPVTFQDVPDGLLPLSLRDANPLGIVRLIDGNATDNPIDRSHARASTDGTEP